MLAYDLFHTGIVYPVGVFVLAEPKWEANPRVVALPGFPAIGRVTRATDRRKLEPDYRPNGDVEHVLLGKLRQARGSLALGTYVRTDAQDHALHPASPQSPLRKIGESERLSRLEDALVPPGDLAARILAEAGLPTQVTARLDGRAKQLLFESRLAERALGKDARSYALPAHPLCLLAEYEVQKLLAGAARKRLETNRSLLVRAPRGWCRLSWIPDPTAEEYGFGTAIAMLYTLAQGEVGFQSWEREDAGSALCQIKDFRNRLAHSHFLEKHHYADLRSLVRKVLGIIYGGVHDLSLEDELAE